MVKVSALLVMVLGFAMMNRGIAFTGNTFGGLRLNSQSRKMKGSLNFYPYDHKRGHPAIAVTGKSLPKNKRWKKHKKQNKIVNSIAVNI